MKFMGYNFNKKELFGIVLFAWGVNMWILGIPSMTPFIGIILLYCGWEREKKE